MSLQSLSCCFESHDPHRALPSFPTRRSSDLLSSAAMRRAAARVARRRGSSMTIRRPASHASSSSASGTRVVLPAPGGACSTRPRSEEHTSELQSLAYLVCRLLLEKKKRQLKI